MSEKDFSDGFLDYKAVKMQPDKLSFLKLSEWDDGYIAFSAHELTLSDEKLKSLFEFNGGSLCNNIDKKAEELGISSSENKESWGYIMEIDLWKHKDGIYEEISLEREDDGWVVQTWKLKTKLDDGEEGNCYWRYVKTIPRGNKYMLWNNSLQSIETVVPEYRLHFFITIKGQGNEKG